MADRLTGRLLVATPGLQDPNFTRTVVLVLEHGDGALGVVLNRPSETGIEEVLPGWRELAAGPPFVFVGGPVQPDTALCLGAVRPGHDPRHWREISPGFGIVDLEGDPAESGESLTTVRVFAGYAGWVTGQIEAEIEAGAWVVVEATLRDVVSPDPEHLWRDVLRRQPGALAFLSTFPVDPTLN